MQQVLPPLPDAFALANAGQLNAAIPIIERHAVQGNGEALFALADMYWRGVGFERDMSRARELFGKSSDAGFPMAERAYTNLLASGIGGIRDWPGALKRLEAESRSDFLRNRMYEAVMAMDLTPWGDPKSVPVGERLSERPSVKLFRNAFTPAECDFLILLAEPTYDRSLVTMEGRDVRDPVRTSDGSTIHWLIEDPATHAINRRLASLTGTMVDQGEPLYILRYRPGQQYHPHTDWLPPPNRRIMTALLYLNDDYEGGETAFVKTGLKVRAHKGDVLTFISAGPDGELDPLSEHAGLPVTKGTKYLASRWIRERRHTG
jgi:prolyl 4-hydroxylase